MSSPPSKKPLYHRDPRPLPTQADFDPWNGDPDAMSSWKHFGGLSLGEAWEVFATNPGALQEDFMFMGPVAFRYYSPVLDRHLREADPEAEGDDCQAWIIGESFAGQVKTLNGASNEFVEEVRSLCGFMLQNSERFALFQPRDQRRLEKVWGEALTALANHTGP
jgi:hypothetical protein